MLSNELDVQINGAVEVLRSGGVVAVPTDTLYGLAASASDVEAVKRVYHIKRRLGVKAIPLLIADGCQIGDYAEHVSDIAKRLATAFFPGALTLVLRSNDQVPDEITAGMGTVALRVPDHPVPRAIARQLGGAITGTSANRSGEHSATTAGEVRHQLGTDVDLVVDGGECRGGKASTVVDVTGSSLRVLREGAVLMEELETVLGFKPVRACDKD